MTLQLAALWLRLELRRRWQPVVLLAVLVALASGALLTALTGARRGASAPDRLLARTLPATAVAHTNQLGQDVWPAVRKLPGVAALSAYPGYSGFGVDELPAETRVRYMPLDDEAMRTLERPVVLAGRLANPARADEAVVTELFVRHSGRGVGDTVTVRLFSLAQIDAGVSAVSTVDVPRPEGPAIRTRIVGVIRSAWFNDEPGTAGRLFPSPGVFRKYPQSLLGAKLDGERWALVRLTDGEAGLPRFRAQLAQLMGGPGATVTARSQAVDQLRTVSRFQSGCLAGLAAIVLLAGGVVIGTAVSRQVAATRPDLDVLIALGAAPRRVPLLGAAGPSVAGAAGTLLGAGLSVGTSRWLPYGAAARLEPSPGIMVDWLILVAGVLGLSSLIAGWAVLAGLRRTARLPAIRASRTATAVARTDLPVGVLVGSRHALDPGSGRFAVPVRSAVAGTVVGVLGVVAAATFGVGVDDAASDPARFGQTFQISISVGLLSHDVTDVRAVTAATRRQPGVESVFDMRFNPAEMTGPSGTVSASIFGMGSPRDGVLVSGRAPHGDREAVLAPGTARRLGADIGDTVDVEARALSQESPGAIRTTTVAPRTVTGRLTVTGIGFVPQTVYNEYDNGVWTDLAGYRRFFGAGFINHELRVAVAPGQRPVPLARRLIAATAPIDAGYGSGAITFIDVVPVPDRALEITALRVLPVGLAAFLALLAMAATAHVLTVSGRRRGPELALLRALGMTGRQAFSVPAVQALVYGLVGLVLGIPLGIAAGRVLWRLVADMTPLDYLPPLDLPVMLVIVPATLLVVLLLAVPAARRAARSPIAAILRAE